MASPCQSTAAVSVVLATEPAVAPETKAHSIAAEEVADDAAVAPETHVGVSATEVDISTPA
jgi:hypothetical protein